MSEAHLHRYILCDCRCQHYLCISVITLFKNSTEDQVSLYLLLVLKNYMLYGGSSAPSLSWCSQSTLPWEGSSSPSNSVIGFESTSLPFCQPVSYKVSCTLSLHYAVHNDLQTVQRKRLRSSVPEHSYIISNLLLIIMRLCHSLPTVNLLSSHLLHVVCHNAVLSTG